ncbi:MAG: DUF3105 domain-containing protein [Candidatus Spechtbacterales bacterium]|nr:DUF3105 domain-containing protein [Candidatus Spechtbacterales bacterium]
MTKENYEKKKEKRKKKKERQRAEAKKEKIKKQLTWFGVILLIVGVLGYLIYIGTKNQAELVGEFHASQGEEHVVAGEEEPYEWNTYPPTGGWHDANPLPGSFYETEQNLPRIIHSLEHGAVVIYYKDSVPQEELDQLRDLYERFRRDKVVVAPLNDMDTNYALTAWQWIDKFDTYNEQRIINFIDDHLNKGPEAASIGSHL